MSMPCSPPAPWTGPSELSRVWLVFQREFVPLILHRSLCFVLRARKRPRSCSACGDYGAKAPARWVRLGCLKSKCRIVCAEGHTRSGAILSLAVMLVLLAPGCDEGFSLPAG